MCEPQPTQSTPSPQGPRVGRAANTSTLASTHHPPLGGGGGEEKRGGGVGGGREGEREGWEEEGGL